LERLAQSLAIHHKDGWLAAFLHSGSSPRSVDFLVDAIRANHDGNANAALKFSAQASKNFQREGNIPGFLRAEFEQVYALRRSSKAPECAKRAETLSQAASLYKFQWIQIQTTIEASSCQGMQARYDAAWAFATRARDIAIAANYQILHLRALGLLGNLDMIEGRSDASWLDNGEGLDLFWQGAYPDERAFQFYYNLQVDAERRGSIFLAMQLQRETLAMIAGQSRFDFEAMAHFRMACAAERAGDPETARREIALYTGLISKLPISPARDLYQAYCEIGLARLALNSAKPQESKQHLDKARPVVSATENAMLRLEYLKTAADADRSSGDTEHERLQLIQITHIGESGFESLKSVLDRWHWQQVIDESYRRLLEIELASHHSPEHAFEFWQSYHQLESALPLAKTITPSDISDWQKVDINNLAQLHDSSLISYTVLSHSVIAWVIDDRGIREFTLPMTPAELKREALRFYLMCSDPNSSIQKVNASGSRLYQWLIAPLEQALEPGRTLEIEPDAVLSFVPWAALKMDNGGYLGTSRNIVIAAGFGTTRGHALREAGSTRVAIAVPDSLNFNGDLYPRLLDTDEEVQQMRKLFPNTKVLRGDAVTAATMVRELPRTDIFEFAGHAVTREHGGELILSSRSGAEILSGSRLAELHLDKTRIVVLAACSTAAEEDVDRDPNGLVRTLLNAGAGSVLATRWDVDSDATAKGVEQFFRSFKTGKSKSQALQAAREKLQADDKFTHPYYWAGIELFQ
jgi:CHAT domain-containing protein